MDRLHIAQLAHEVNRAYCASLGDTSQPAWADAPAWQRDSAAAGVDMHIANPDATPEQSHESWLAQKKADGWAWGEVKDAEKKLHPCFLPYAELPPEQKAKDYLFRGVVHAALALPLAPAPVATEIGDTIIVQNVRNGINVQYVGREEPYTDRLYGSNLTFSPNQVRRMPGELAMRFLRHADVFLRVADQEAVAQTAAPAAPLVAPKPDAALVAEGAFAVATTDDTAAVLEQAKLDKAKEDTETDRTQDVIDQLGDMGKDALQDFALVHYGQKVPKNLSVENMRTRVGDMVRQYGNP